MQESNDSSNCQQQQLIIDQLQEQILQLSSKVTTLMQENSDLRQKNYQILITTEQEEEYVSNMLLKQIQRIRKEKGEALDLAEKEEEYLTMLMTKKLRQLQHEKILLENAMEAEQEFIVNKLYKQIELLTSKHRRSIALKETMPPILEKLANEIDHLEGQVAEKKALCRQLLHHVLESEHFECKRRVSKEGLQCEECAAIEQIIQANNK